MTIKELAYTAQQYLQANTGTQFKRAHIYELLAATFGFNSYAALCANAVLSAHSSSGQRPSKYGDQVRTRCLEIGYLPAIAHVVASKLPALMTEHQIGIIRISDLIAHLRYEAGMQDDILDEEDQDEWNDGEDYRWDVSEALLSPLMLDGLTAAADKGNASAHYALALLHAPSDDDIDGPEVGGGYWYAQAKSGRILSGVEKEWADAHATRLVNEQTFVRHLREAAKLGNPDALLDMADRFDDPAFFEQTIDDVNTDPAWIADIAERLGRPDDARKWLTEAAKMGDTEAMRRLIDRYDRDDLQRCWTWVYLAELLETDLTRDEYEAFHENGERYDDDVGGPMYVDGRDGVTLDPISAELDAAARSAAQKMFRGIERLDD
jgi:TPR repeat protein